MKYTVFSLSFAQGSTAEEAIATSADVGFDGVDLRAQRDGHVFSDALPARRAEILDCARRHGIAISGIMGYYGAKLFSTDRSEAEAEVRGLLDELDLAKALEAEYIRIMPGLNPADRTTDNMERFVANVRRVTPRAEDLGIDIGIEIHPGLIWNGESSRDALHGIDSDRVGIFYDPPLMVLHDRLDPVAELELIIDRVLSVHFKDYHVFEYGHKPSYEWVPLGSGIVPTDEVLSALRKAGFDRYLCVEYLKWWESDAGGKDGKLPEAAEALPHELHYLKEAMGA